MEGGCFALSMNWKEMDDGYFSLPRNIMNGFWQYPQMISSAVCCHHFRTPSFSNICITNTLQLLKKINNKHFIYPCQKVDDILWVNP